MSFEQDPVLCPYCEHDCRGTAEFVDNGVGLQQVSAYCCDNCHAFQMGPEALKPWPSLEYNDGITEEEKRLGWYRGDITPKDKADD